MRSGFDLSWQHFFRLLRVCPRAAGSSESGFMVLAAELAAHWVQQALPACDREGCVTRRIVGLPETFESP